MMWTPLCPQLVLKNPLKEDTIIFTKLVAVLWNTYFLRYFWGCYLSAKAKWNRPPVEKLPAELEGGAGTTDTHAFTSETRFKAMISCSTSASEVWQCPRMLWKFSSNYPLKNNFYTWFVGQIRTMDKITNYTWNYPQLDKYFYIPFYFYFQYQNTLSGTNWRIKIRLWFRLDAGFGKTRCFSNSYPVCSYLKSLFPLPGLLPLQFALDSRHKEEDSTICRHLTPPTSALRTMQYYLVFRD